ncbi:MAG: glycosyltransferase family 2 protein [Campylobacteraceae bacterium]|nr:glycosyltransferase family 2 protein [Campylobacteraceae bacterium]
MNLQNKVSILIPVYNRENLIEETVQSALNQTYKNIEIIVVDNQSKDKTWEVLQKLASQDERIKIFQNETNIGPVRNWKRCIDEASGEYGKILWSDDLIAPDFLEKTVPYLENKDVGFVFIGTEIFIDGTDKKTSHYFIGETGIYESEKYINGVLFDGGYPVSPGCALFRLKDLKKNLLVDIPNKVNSDFAMHAIGNDLLIFLLTAHQYKKFAFVNEKLSFFRAHEGSISIQSDDGKLPLHYNLASAYFLENYREYLIYKMNTKIWLFIKGYSLGSKKDGLGEDSNYYLNNKKLSLNFNYLFKKILKKIIHLGI